ncbi:MAG: NAD(P)-dependent oxidoreductase [Betaproteobacteria bacterium]|nr:NAD(P)-dependent oxidoreductase [Betaproteobacteria bacterium]
MPIKTIGVVSPGDMGQAVAMRLKECGFDVLAALDGRSERTKSLARQAGLEDCRSLHSLASRCDLILSIIDPGAALDTARAAAAAIASIGNAADKPVYAECNALSPHHKREMESMIRDAGGRFIDVGIIGPPPRGAGNVRLYASGPEAGMLEAIRHEKLVIRVVSERVGDAAAVKMCYGAITKGMIALGTEMMVAAHRLGVSDAVEAEMRESRREIHDWLLASIPPMPPKAYRWVPETREIAATFEDTGVTPRMMLGATDMYEFIAATPLGVESPEAARAEKRAAIAVVSALAESKSSTQGR